CRADDHELRIFLNGLRMGRFVDPRNRNRDAVVRSSDLSGHEIDIVVESDGKKHIGFTHAGFTLDIYVDAVSVDELNTFEVGRATEAAGLFVDKTDLMSSFEQRGYGSESHSAVSDNHYSHLYPLSLP